MKKALTALAFWLIASLATTPAAAQQLPQGIWTGTMTPPGGQAFNVSYEVGTRDGALVVAMMSIIVQEVIRFQDVRLTGDELTFWWEPGIRVDCRLRRTESGSYEGPCTPGGGGPAGAITMVPPA